MKESKYTNEQIIEALEVRMPHDEVCREAYDLIQRQAKALSKVREIHDLGIKELGILKVNIVAALDEARANAITEFAQEIVYGVLTQFDDVDTKVSLAITKKAKELRDKEIKWF